MSHVSRYRNAHKLFDKTPKRNPPAQTSVNHIPPRTKQPYLVDPFEHFDQNEVTISWTSKISNLVRQKRPQEAIGLFKTLLIKNRQCMNYVTVLSAIKAIGQVGSEDMVCVIHSLAMKMGFVKAEVSVMTALVSVYSAFDVESAWKVFDHARDKDVILWSAMLTGFVRNRAHVKAVELFKEMQVFGMNPNHVTIVSLLPSCVGLGALNSGKEIHGYCIKRVLYNHVNIHNSLVDMYAKCGDLEAAIQVFSDMLEKDVVSWRIVIRGCIENRCYAKALGIFSKMRALGFEKIDEGIIMEIIGLCSEFDEKHIRFGFHGLVLKLGLTGFAPILTALLQLYADIGNIHSARILFDQIDQKDVVAWSTMIAAYAKSTQPYKAFETLQQMQLHNEKPNEFTFVNLLQANCLMAGLEIGEGIHAQVTKRGYSSNTYLASALIDIYCKFGRIMEGKSIFHENPAKDFICWSSMINGYGINGLGNEALDCFSDMLSCGIEPNEVVFISVLSACSHCGLEYEGWTWFRAMEDKYGITPNLAHYACMVDMLSRNGSIEEALEFINNMPMEPDKRIWGALLAGCRNSRGGIEVTELVAEKGSGLGLENVSYYVGLSNLYAEQGRWDEVEKLRRLIDRKALKKEVGYSMI